MAERVELLSPAGDLERLRMALHFGADAVYLAGREFGMRSSTVSFDDEALKTAVKEAHAKGAKVYVTCNTLPREDELKRLPDYLMFLQEIGLEQSGLDRLVKECYSLLGLISFLTAGKPEVRAWTITKGTKAPQAAGKIHSDFERGFIRAEIVSYADLMACGSMAVAKEKGLLRLEGKDYVMQDGDVTLFRFNV